MQEQEYVEKAKTRIVELVEHELALVVLEVEARIAEAGFADSGLNIDPHHITTALRELTQAGVVNRVDGTTRGGGSIPTVQPADPRRRTTAIARAAARKRLLYARYLSWAQSSVRHPSGRVGPAGEEAVRSALRASGALQPAQPSYGEVASILGVNLSGPVDSAGYLVPFINNLPGVPVTVLVEVKNLRGWIYPHSAELYQLLSKAATLQEHRPDQPIVPVFICRKAHRTTFWMASQLGFMVIEMGAQFVGDIDQDSLNEVRSELQFLDLYQGSGPSKRVQERFRDTLPRHCTTIAERWRNTALNPTLVDCIHALRAITATHDRSPWMEQLRTEGKQSGLRGGW